MPQYKYSRDDYYRLTNAPCLDVAKALGMEINERESEHALVADHGFFAKTSVEDTAYFILALSAKGANHHNICIPLK